jgi:TonB family protein
MRRLPLFLAGLIAAAPAAAQQTPADSARVYELAEVEVLPRPRNAKVFAEALHRAYPQHLRAAGVGGTVQVAFVVGPDGEPRNVRVVSTSDSSFDAPSVQAASLLRFAPAQVQGRPVAVRVEQPITWRVELAAAAGSTGSVQIGEGEWELNAVEELPSPRNIPTFQMALAREYPVGMVNPPVRATVQVRFRLLEDGTVDVPTVTRSTDSRFNDPTLRAIQVLRFSPAKVNGRPVKVWVEQPVEWVPPPASPQPSSRERGRRRSGTFTTPTPR